MGRQRFKRECGQVSPAHLGPQEPAEILGLILCPVRPPAATWVLREWEGGKGDFNTTLSPTDRSSRQKINKETQTLNDTIDQIDLTDVFRTFHLKAEEYTFLPSAHGTFSRIDHIMGHKSNLGKFKKIEIVSSIFLTTML